MAYMEKSGSFIVNIIVFLSSFSVLSLLYFGLCCIFDFLVWADPCFLSFVMCNIICFPFCKRKRAKLALSQITFCQHLKFRRV